jgi:hypothetical protein
MSAGKILLSMVLAMVGAVLLMCEPSDTLASLNWLLVLVLTKTGGVACLWAAYRLTRKIMEVMSHAD